MQGEFKGDFTRDTHNPLKRFSRVLMQQGRVLLDADWNEQTSIVLHYLRSLAADLIGPHGGPKGQFEILAPKGSEDFTISEGHYYVDGILCENKKQVKGDGGALRSTYFRQPHYPFDVGTKTGLPKGRFLAYLDVWERHVTFLTDEDPKHDEPSIREVALGGPDTASRAQVIWQVKLLELTDLSVTPGNLTDPDEGFENFRAVLTKASAIPGVPGQLRARARKPQTEDDNSACVTSPESRYRGVENQLFRVEVHKPGVAWNGVLPSGNPDDEDALRKPGLDPFLREPNLAEAATFKWSRENGSVVFGIRNLARGNGETTVMLTDLGRDARFSLKEGDWVEIVHDAYILQNRADSLLQVRAINRDERSVTLRGVPGNTIDQKLNKHLLLRRWDHRGGDSRTGGLTINKDDGAALIPAGAGERFWLHLEDGVEIQFQALESATYKTGDYWLIPARVATGDVEWPGPAGEPASLPPHGIQHHYAPLALIEEIVDGKITGAVTDLRKTL